MPALDQTFANALLDASFDRAGASVRLATGPMHCRLITTVGSATASGTELGTGGNYTSGTGAPTFTTAAAATGSTASNSAISITNMPATTLNGVEVWDSAPARKWFGSITGAPKVINSGDTFSIASASLTAGIS
jgi:hypothetical protein